MGRSTSSSSPSPPASNSSRSFSSNSSDLPPLTPPKMPRRAKPSPAPAPSTATREATLYPDLSSDAPRCTHRAIPVQVPQTAPASLECEEDLGLTSDTAAASGEEPADGRGKTRRHARPDASDARRVTIVVAEDLNPDMSSDRSRRCAARQRNYRCALKNLMRHRCSPGKLILEKDPRSRSSTRRSRA